MSDQEARDLARRVVEEAASAPRQDIALPVLLLSVPDTAAVTRAAGGRLFVEIVAELVPRT